MKAGLAGRADPQAVVVHVIPLLVETGRTRGFDAIVVVDLPPELQVQRAIGRDGSREDQARARISAQAGREERLAVADLVIDNGGDREALIHRADEVWRELRERVATAG